MTPMAPPAGGAIGFNRSLFAKAPEMTKTSAIKQARDESSMYRFGDGWVLTTWDGDCRAWREGHARPFDTAQADLLEWRFDRVMELLGREDAAYTADRYFGPLEDRVTAALAGAA